MVVVRVERARAGRGVRGPAAGRVGLACLGRAAARPRGGVTGLWMISTVVQINASLAEETSLAHSAE